MANRAYLYATSQDMGIIRDLSEHRNEVSFVYKVLLGKDTREEISKIWDYEAPIAISADLEGGLARLDALYEALKTVAGLDASKLSTFQQQTKAYFEQHPDRRLARFFMEGGEAYDMVASDANPIEKENEYVFNQIQRMAIDIDRLLASPPSKLEELREQFPSLSQITADMQELEPYWTTVTYFSFNKSGS